MQFGTCKLELATFWSCSSRLFSSIVRFWDLDNTSMAACIFSMQVSWQQCTETVKIGEGKKRHQKVKERKK